MLLQCGLKDIHYSRISFKIKCRFSLFFFNNQQIRKIGIEPKTHYIKDMALPTCFQEPDEYFEQCLQFFEEYQYLFKFPNTDLLTEKILDTIDINLGNNNIMTENFDIRSIRCSYLDIFFEKIDNLKTEYKEINYQEKEFLLDIPLSPKKKHEITYLAKEIDSFCQEINCKTVVDFGSGLGYLDQQLFETTDFNVLGLEGNQNIYLAAKKRQRKYHINSLERIKYIKYTIKEDSHVNIEKYLDEKFPTYDSFCITGLHACADLTIDAMNIFLNTKTARGLIIMSCCYHRMSSDGVRFKNFPLSESLKSFCHKNNCFELLTVPFLRLAAQKSTECIAMEDSVFNLLSRAVLQLYASRHNCKLKRTKRKAVRLKLLKNNFEDYIQDAVNGFQLIFGEELNKTENVSFDIDEVISIWRQLSDVSFKKAAIFILLQNYMQPLFENFILYDRLLYLQENGLNCKYKKIVDNTISPRCLALLAQKV